MKVVRTKTEKNITDRNGTRQAKIALYISGLNHQDEFGRYVAEVKDFACVPVQNPQPGEPLNRYELLENAKRSKVRLKDQIDTMFSYIGASITPDESFTDAFADLQAKSLLLETQQNPLYGTTADEWEIVDTSTEIAQ